MELEEAFRILEGDKELQYKYGNDSDGCINPQIAIDEAILAIQNYINFEVIPKKKIEDKKQWLKENILQNDYANELDKDIAEYQVNILEELLEDK